MKLTYICLLVLFISCGSNEKYSQSSDSSIEDLFESINNDDFKRPPQVPFRKRDDYLKPEEITDDSLKAESAERYTESVLEDLESSENPLFVLLSYCKTRRYKEASVLADKLYARYSKHPGYWNQLGTCYLKKGDFGRAEIMYNKSRKINTKYAPPVNNIGVILFKKGFSQKALAAFKRATELAPFSLTPAFNHSNILLQFGHYKKAQIVLKKLYTLNDRDKDILNTMAVSEIMKGSPNKALSYYNKIDSSFLKDAKYGVNYALALYLTGKKNEARVVVENLNGSVSKKFNEYLGSVKKLIRGMK